jgi:hypothetical protein
MGQKNRWEGARSFIDVESGTGPVRAPCPKRAVAELRSADRRTEIILLYRTTLLYYFITIDLVQLDNILLLLALCTLIL